MNNSFSERVLCRYTSINAKPAAPRLSFWCEETSDRFVLSAEVAGSKSNSACPPLRRLPAQACRWPMDRGAVAASRAAVPAAAGDKAEVAGRRGRSYRRRNFGQTERGKRPAASRWSPCLQATDDRTAEELTDSVDRQNLAARVRRGEANRDARFTERRRKQSPA